MSVDKWPRNIQGKLEQKPDNNSSRIRGERKVTNCCAIAVNAWNE